MLTLKGSIIYAEGFPLFAFDSPSEALTYLRKIGYRESKGGIYYLAK